MKPQEEIAKLAEQYVAKFNVPSDKSAEKFYKAGYNQCQQDNASLLERIKELEEFIKTIRDSYHSMNIGEGNVFRELQFNLLTKKQLNK